MLKYGFFNSVDGDRLYDAETFNTFFEGLISPNGIFEGIEDAFSVTPNGTGLTLNIGTGKAMVNSCWVKNESIESLTINPAHAILNRYDAVVLRWDATSRDITLAIKEGTPASEPVKPQPEKSSLTWEIILAYIHVLAGATSLTSANIQDCRYDTSLCGVITGLIKQVDTTSLYNQYLAKFDDLENELKEYQTAQQNAFETWFNALTEQLNVNTYINRNVATYNTTSVTRYIDLPEELNYVDGDILDVFVNGALLAPGVDYEIQTNEIENVPMIYVADGVASGKTITFYVLKSQIGWQ